MNAEVRKDIINDRHMFNCFRMAYTRLRHSKRERRHYVHYICRLGDVDSLPEPVKSVVWFIKKMTEEEDGST